MGADPRGGTTQRPMVARSCPRPASRRIRILNIVDDVTRGSLAAIPYTSIFGVLVVRELMVLVDLRGWPETIVSDHGTELSSNALFAWSKDHGAPWR